MRLRIAHGGECALSRGTARQCIHIDELHISAREKRARHIERSPQLRGNGIRVDLKELERIGGKIISSPRKDGGRLWVVIADPEGDKVELTETFKNAECD